MGKTGASKEEAGEVRSAGSGKEMEGGETGGRRGTEVGSKQDVGRRRRKEED